VLFLPIQVHYVLEVLYPQDFQSCCFCRTIAKPVHKPTKEKLFIIIIRWHSWDVIYLNHYSTC
jgi:hypothetical protein